MQFDGAWYLNEQHIIRTGYEATNTSEVLNTDTAVFPVTSSGAQASDVPENISDDSTNEAWAYGIYVQDEWHVFPAITLSNYAHFATTALMLISILKGSSARAPIWFGKLMTRPRPMPGLFRAILFTATRAKYQRPARSTNSLAPPTPPPAPPTILSAWSDPIITKPSAFHIRITTPWSVTLDGFYKQAHQLVDLGQFGDAVILSPYNYKEGTVEGAEFSSTYRNNGLSLFGNFSWVLTNAHGIDTQQFQFDPDELA